MGMDLGRFGGSIPGLGIGLTSQVPPNITTRMPCDRWFMKLRDGSADLSEGVDWTKEMIDAVAQGQADNPEARVVLSELHDKFLRVGAISAPVIGDGFGAYYGASAAKVIRQGDPLYTEKHDDSDENWGDRISKSGVDVGMVQELMIGGCDPKDVPLAALRSGFYLDANDSRDWIKRAFEDLKAGKVSLEEVRAALRDGCLNEIGRAHDFRDSGRKYKDDAPVEYLEALRRDLDDGKAVRMYTKFLKWPFGVNVPALLQRLPLPAFNLDTPGSKIPGIKGAQ